MRDRTYICIDLKSYYASVECVKRGLDPMTARLVVADPARGSGTICLAVSPALKALGVRNRCRVFEIPENIDYVMATPQMRRYIEVSAQIVATYLRHVSMEDVHVYSVDECFIDVTPYLSLNNMSAIAFARRLKDAVMEETGIPSTCGIGPNLFLCKVALDIEAKHAPDGIALMDENIFKERIWHHRPITDVWGIGRGISARLAHHGIFDLFDITQADPELLRAEFGVNADLLIDHAWGQEPCTIRQIKEYVPRGSSINSGQVLMRDYTKKEALVILQEMIDEVLFQLLERHAVCSRVSVMVGYSYSSDSTSRSSAMRKLDAPTSRRSIIVPAMKRLYDEVADARRGVRRLSVGVSDLAHEDEESIDLLTNMEELRREKSLMRAVGNARERFGRDAVMRGTSLLDCATARERAHQIGGHRA